MLRIYEGPELSVIPDAEYNDDSSCLDYGTDDSEGPDLSMIPEPLSSSNDMPIIDDGMEDEVFNISTALEQSESLENASETDECTDSTEPETKSETDSDTRTEELRYEDVPWPLCDSFPDGHSDHESGGPWIPKRSDYSYL